jgi:hypothetical protein
LIPQGTEPHGAVFEQPEQQRRPLVGQQIEQYPARAQFSVHVVVIVLARVTGLSHRRACAFRCTSLRGGRMSSS